MLLDDVSQSDQQRHLVFKARKGGILTLDFVKDSPFSGSGSPDRERFSLPHTRRWKLSELLDYRIERVVAVLRIPPISQTLCLGDPQLHRLVPWQWVAAKKGLPGLWDRGLSRCKFSLKCCEDTPVTYTELAYKLCRTQLSYFCPQDFETFRHCHPCFHIEARGHPGLNFFH